MGVYRPAEFPRRSNHKSVLTEAQYQIKLRYYRYEIITGQYLMSPNEKLAYNLILLSLFGLFISAIYYYFPRAAISSLQQLSYYITGTHKVKLEQMLSAMDNDAQASLSTVASSLNASSILALWGQSTGTEEGGKRQ